MSRSARAAAGPVAEPIAGTILERILVARRRRVADAKVCIPPAAMATRAERLAEAARTRRPARHVFGLSPLDTGFRETLERTAASHGIAVIAEIKRASPSAGPLPLGSTVAEQARAYRDGGAAALSVLTEPDFFGARPGDLDAAVAAAGLPALRKDFVVDAYQVDEARVLGAAAVLLIAAALQPAELARLMGRARELGLDALVEVHDRPELEQALACDAGLIGINNRDLRTFRTDLAVTEQLAPLVPADRFVVAESGLRQPADVRRAVAAGARAVLVGEGLIRAGDPRAAVASFACATVAEGSDAACS